MSEVYEIDQEPDCPDCGYRCFGFVDGEACSSSCHFCGGLPPKNKNRDNSGYWAQIKRPPRPKDWICDECYNSGVDEEEECPDCGYYHDGRCSETDHYDDDYDCDFADPGGRSALRRETEDNPRDQPCPNCDSPNRLTPADVALGYQCDSCADRAEMGMEY